MENLMTSIGRLDLFVFFFCYRLRHYMLCAAYVYAMAQQQTQSIIHTIDRF